MSCETAASHVAARTPGERVIPAEPQVQRDGSGGGRDDEPPGQDAGDDQNRLHCRDADGDLHPSAAQPARELALAMLDDETAHAPTVDTAGPVASACRTGVTTQVWPLRTQRSGRRFGPLPVDEEAVDAGAGATHVGAECPRLAQPLGHGGRGEIVRRERAEVLRAPDGSERREQRIPPLREAVGAVPDVEGAVDVTGRGLDRARGNDQHDRVVGRQVDGSENGAVSRAELRPAA